jgi:hypothetical protein
MLEQVIAAPFALLKRPGLYLLALVIVLIQGGLSIIAGDYLGYFSVSIAELQFPLDIPFMVGLLAFVVSTSIPVYLHASIAAAMNPSKNAPLPPMGLIGSSLGMGLLLGMVGLVLLGIGLFLSSVISLTGGFVSLIGVILFLILGLVAFFALIKFMFAPTFLGKGFPIKDALAESWKITTGKFFQALLIALLLMIIGVFVGSIPGILPVDLSNEWVELIVSSLFAALTGGFSAVLLALIARTDTNTFTLGTRHAHKK